MPDNTVTIVGNLTQDPEMRFTPNGVAMVKLSIAVNRRRFNRDSNTWEDGDASFFNATCWRDLAENVSESLRKGTRVVITGRLEQRSWETQDGDRRSIVEIQVDEIGPSLKWATASVTRIPRGGGWSGGGQQANVPPAPVARNNPPPDEAPF
ncbi:MAG: single-stranded DNA-binding protein [bacterium]|nr:single-stranded DNA-binding protein [bacterium]